MEITETAVVAEGIKDNADLEWLTKADCPVGQGFVFARFMPAEALPDWLATLKSNGLCEQLEVCRVSSPVRCGGTVTPTRRPPSENPKSRLLCVWMRA